VRAVLKIAIQGHADIEEETRGRGMRLERKRERDEGKGEREDEDESQRERRSGMERRARGGERASIAILHRTEIDTGTAGVTRGAGKSGGGVVRGGARGRKGRADCQPGVSVFFAKALRTRPQISPAHGSQLRSRDLRDSFRWPALLAGFRTGRQRPILSSSEINSERSDWSNAALRIIRGESSKTKSRKCSRCKKTLSDNARVRLRSDRVSSRTFPTIGLETERIPFRADRKSRLNSAGRNNAARMRTIVLFAA